MKYPWLVVHAILASCSIVRAADASCTNALDTEPSISLSPLPKACTVVGPLRLGMTHSWMTHALGLLDMDSTGNVPDDIAACVFPRNPAARLAARPTKQADLHHADLYVAFRENRIVAIEVETDPEVPFPYASGNIAISGSVDALLGRIKLHPTWNASKDNVRLSPYAMDVKVDPETRRITGVTIAAGVRFMHTIPRSHFHRVKEPTTALVSGYWVSAGH